LLLHVKWMSCKLNILTLILEGANDER